MSCHFCFDLERSYLVRRRGPTNDHDRWSVTSLVSNVDAWEATTSYLWVALVNKCLGWSRRFSTVVRQTLAYLSNNVSCCCSSCCLKGLTKQDRLRGDFNDFNVLDFFYNHVIRLFSSKDSNVYVYVWIRIHRWRIWRNVYEGWS